MRRYAPQTDSGEGSANGVVGIVFFRITISRREEILGRLAHDKTLTHMNSPIFTGASMDKAGASHLPLNGSGLSGGTSGEPD